MSKVIRTQIYAILLKNIRHLSVMIETSCANVSRSTRCSSLKEV